MRDRGREDTILEEGGIVTETETNEVQEVQVNNTNNTVEGIIQITMQIYQEKLDQLTNEILTLKERYIKSEQKNKKRVNMLKKKITKQEQQSKKQTQAIIQTTNQQLKQQRNLIEKYIVDNTSTPPPKPIIIFDNEESEVFSPTKQVIVDDDEEEVDTAEVVDAAAANANAAAEAQETRQRSPPPSVSPIPVPPATSNPRPFARCEIPPPPCLQQDQPLRDPSKRYIDAMVIGTSIVKHASGRNIKRATGRSTKVCSFSGANSKKVSEHSHIELKYFSPKTVIIHAGGNDLAEGKRSDDVLKQVSDLGHSLKEKGVKNIAVSAVTPRTKLKWEIKNLNHVLKNECRSQGFDFIPNSNISFYNHVCADGVHLNYDGVSILEGNFSNYLRNVELGNEE